jgi:hypothetical protein
MHPPAQQAELGGLPPPWTKENTVDFLNRYPLPTSFAWPGKDGKPLNVCPSYQIKHGYGKWLHDTPYYPGLFEAIHEVLISFGENLPSEAELIAGLEPRKARLLADFAALRPKTA